MVQHLAGFERWSPSDWSQIRNRPSLRYNCYMDSIYCILASCSDIAGRTPDLVVVEQPVRISLDGPWRGRFQTDSKGIAKICERVGHALFGKAHDPFTLST